MFQGCKSLIFLAMGKLLIHVNLIHIVKEILVNLLFPDIELSRYFCQNFNQTISL